MTAPITHHRQRLAPIEGLRAYLAFWVLIAHVIWASGFQAAELSVLPKVVLKGRYAVEVFMIISGFVIFALLDKRQETYKQFVIRRFFRLFPVFALLFIAAIPASQLMLSNALHAGQYCTPPQISNVSDQVHSWWSNLRWHVPLHLLMLHGAVPNALVENSATAFLMPAWSLSVEWQFYLLAPVAYVLAVSSKGRHRFGLCALCAVVFVAAKAISRAFPPLDLAATLPYNVEFFFLGAASYFLYKRHSENPFCDAPFLIFCTIALFLFVLGGSSRLELIAAVLWLAFFGLILENPASFYSRLVSPLFANTWVQYLGRISYSIYLSHVLVLIVAQHAMLKWAPELSRTAHFWVLLALTLSLTTAVSAVFYRFVEAPGMRFGHFLARRLDILRMPNLQPAPAPVAASGVSAARRPEPVLHA